MSPVSSDHPSNISNETPAADARFWLAAIAESSDDAIVGKDLNGVVKSWNKAAEAMFGFTAEEIVGQSITCIIPADRSDEEASIIARIAKNERIVHFETERQHKSGRLIPVSITVSPIRDDQNVVIGVSKIARDLTERDLREAKLRASNAELERLARHLAKARDAAEGANRAKSGFLASISHELRTPLNGILGYAQLLHMEGDLNAVQTERVKKMITAGTHLLQLVTKVLELSALEKGLADVQAVECDAEAIAVSCVELIRPVTTAKGLTLTTAVTPGTERKLVTDPMRLRQILYNLLGNAAKFTAQGEIELRLGTSADRSALRIEVTDTGPGIVADQRHRLFKEFERIDPDTTVEGAGVGLALSARLAALLKGRLGHSDNPGGGSVFWLELPLKLAAESVDATSSASNIIQKQQKQTSALNVLVVDDVPMNRDIAGSFLRSAGHSSTYAESGEEAVVLASSTSFDVILMDVSMPGLGGLEATRRIRSLGGARGQVPVVAVTAHAFAEQVEECRRSGMDGHVAKPFDPTTLLSAIADVTRPDWTPSKRLVSASPSAAPGNALTESELLVLNTKTFTQIARILSPDTVASHLQRIFNDGQAILSDLRKPVGSEQAAKGVAVAMHALASRAGMFGFERVVVLCRHFDRAIETGAADTILVTKAVKAAIEGMLQAIQERSMPNSVTWQFERSESDQQPLLVSTLVSR